MNNLGAASAVHVAAKLVAHCHAAHRRHHAVSDNNGANVFAFAFFDEFLNQHILLSAVQRFNNRFRDFGGIGEYDANALRPLKNFDNDGSAADSINRRQNVFFITYKRRRRDADIMAAENLHGAQFVA